MKKLLLLACLLLRAAFAQIPGTTMPDCVQSLTVTATGRGWAFDNRKMGCNEWTLFWANNTSVSGFSVEIDGAPDANATSGAFAAMTASPGSTNPASSGASGIIVVSGFQPWVSVNVTTLNGAGAMMSAYLVGWRPTAWENQPAQRPRWSVSSSPVAGTQATASKVAGGAGIRHVVDCVSFSAGATTAPALTQLMINLRDGATGAGTVLLPVTVVIPASTGQSVIPVQSCGLNLVGSANTAMTLEFSAGLANLFQTVTVTGYDIQ